MIAFWQDVITDVLCFAVSRCGLSARWAIATTVTRQYICTPMYWRTVHWWQRQTCFCCHLSVSVCSDSFICRSVTLKNGSCFRKSWYINLLNFSQYKWLCFSASVMDVAFGCCDCVCIIKVLHTEFGERAFSHTGPVAWNSLLHKLQTAWTIETFKRQLKAHFSL